MTSEARAEAIDRAERILRTRINEFGVEEPFVQRVPFSSRDVEVPPRPRGTADEYNPALGSRRAQSVQDFLAGFGIPADRFRPLRGSSLRRRPQLGYPTTTH